MAIWAAIGALATMAGSGPARADGWPVYGADAGGSRYSSLRQIDRADVATLTMAWSYRTGEAERRGKAFRRAVFEVTPILADGKLVLCTPFNRLIALDPATGREEWVFDPNISLAMWPANEFICRGVAVWHDPNAAASAPCRTRVFMATNDARLYAVDLATGRPCAGFGHDGFVTQQPDVPPLWHGEYQITSPPTVAGALVIVGSALADNLREHAPTGRVTAFDARTGAIAWTFDPIPRSAADPAAATWGNGSWATTGGGEVWAPAAFDAARDLVFLPTGGPTPTFYGGEHPGANLYTDSVVALRASTGKLVWYFQLVHHDIWDYDLAAQPSLVTIHRDGREIAAVVEATKTGYVFILDRDTGKPVYPVEERKVPPSDVPGEVAYPTQPVPTAPPPIVPQLLRPDDAWGLTFIDRRICRARIAARRSDGLYTPPSLKGTIEYPFTGGGVNWGSGAVDAPHGLYVVNTSRLVHVIQLFPFAEWFTRPGRRGVEKAPQFGTPYIAERSILLSPLRLPCNPPPWGMLTAIDLDRGTVKWNAVLGTYPDSVPLALPGKPGTPNFGGPMITAGGLVFIAAALDDRLRAFDIDTGQELWQGRLPVAGEATPMTYEVGGRQYVVVAAGGNPRAGVKLGDYLIAFALPQR